MLYFLQRFFNFLKFILSFSLINASCSFFVIIGSKNFNLILVSSNSGSFIAFNSFLITIGFLNRKIEYSQRFIEKFTALFL